MLIATLITLILISVLLAVGSIRSSGSGVERPSYTTPTPPKKD